MPPPSSFQGASTIQTTPTRKPHDEANNLKLDWSHIRKRKKLSTQELSESIFNSLGGSFTPAHFMGVPTSWIKDAS